MRKNLGFGLRWGTAVACAMLAAGAAWAQAPAAAKKTCDLAAFVWCVARHPLHLTGDANTFEGADLGIQGLPFVACTIGEMGEPDTLSGKVAMNELLLSLPRLCPGTACVDARELKGHIGDRVHFDTASQIEIGRRYAAEWAKLARPLEKENGP